MTANINGLAAVIARIPDMDGVAERLKHDFATALDYWPYLFFGISVLSITMVSLIGWWALSRVMARLLGIPDVHKLESSTDAATDRTRARQAARRPLPLPHGRPRRAQSGVVEH